MGTQPTDHGGEQSAVEPADRVLVNRTNAYRRQLLDLLSAD